MSGLLSSSKPKAIETTSDQKALDFQRTTTWNDIKERYWPMEEEAFKQGNNVELGRKAREESNIGATPIGYNPYKGGTSNNAGTYAASASKRLVGLRQNEQDRKQSNTVNTIRNQREIEGQGMSDLSVSAGLENSKALSRSAATAAVNQGIAAGVGQLGATAAGYYLTNNGNNTNTNPYVTKSNPLGLTPGQGL